MYIHIYSPDSACTKGFLLVFYLTGPGRGLPAVLKGTPIGTPIGTPMENKEKPQVFQYFHQNNAKSTGFTSFLTTLDAKTMENHCFSIFSSKYCKKHMFYSCF